MISIVKKKYENVDLNSSVFIGYEVTFVDGTISFVPITQENRHYQEILEWVALGNTITDNGGGE
tara:strand:- start:30 stop:221 length:192 start_codon:yes stop_codon:yes gene_type:complete